MINLRKMVLSLLFPLRCPVCDEILSPEETEIGIHATCQEKLYPVQGAVCLHCGRPFRKNLRIYPKSQTNQYLKASEADLSVRNSYLLEDEWDFNNSTKEYCQECRKRDYVYSYSMFSRGDAIVFTSRKEECSPIVKGKALYLYRGDIKLTMYRFKYSNKREYAHFFAKQAVERYPELFFSIPNAYRMDTVDFSQFKSTSEDLGERRVWQSMTSSLWKNCVDAIIPIPMYQPKQRKRGYNQAESFAYALSELTQIPVDTTIIQRIRDTTPQKELDDTERKNNLKNAFQTGKSIVKYKKVIVVDDIYTTGSTMEAVAKELKYIGIHQIYALCICIGEEM